ncbi:MAG: hypothetical protein GC131_03730 [Alphaproteobacteria bacterium]|nr:hypothetical protein [Alphaproteobacteria bacterium]
MYASLVLGIALAFALLYALHGELVSEETSRHTLEIGFAVWLHVISGVLWIGLLWYFNMVQVPLMPKIPAELKPAVGKYIAPEALFWFRWAALATVVTGLLVALLRGFLESALTVQPPAQTIGIGMWMALVMAFNVWFIIWPNQKKVLGMVPADDAAKAKAGRAALMASRTNFVLSFPMLYCMVSQSLVG